MSSAQSTRFAMEYTAQQSTGVSILVVVSILSFLSVAGLLFAILLSAYNTRYSSDRFLFVRTHAAAYFISLMSCWLLQCISSIMSAHWLEAKGVSSGAFCSSQGALKHVADIGVAVWTFVMAAQTFSSLFLEWTPSKYIMWGVLTLGWLFIGVVVGAGAGLLNLKSTDPFYDVNGFWCWIAPKYKLQIITLGYMIILISVVLSGTLYLATFLRLRGNLKRIGWKIVFCQVKDASEKYFSNDRTQLVAKQMLLYPVAYAALVFPTALVRLLSWAGFAVPFEAFVFSESVYVLSGFVNVIVFTSTRRILPLSSMRFGSWYFVPSTRFSDDPHEQAGLHAQDLAEKGAANTNVVFIPQSKPTLLAVPFGAGRKEFQRPAELVLTTERDSWASFYSDRVGVAPPMSSHWSPDTPPLHQSSRLSIAFKSFAAAASKI